MINQAIIQTRIEFYRNTVVEPDSALVAIQAPDGEVFPVAQLGPGVVRGLDSDGKVRVHWARANFDAGMEPQDLRALGRDAHLVTLYHCDGEGRHSNYRYE